MKAKPLLLINYTNEINLNILCFFCCNIIVVTKKQSWWRRR